MATTTTTMEEEILQEMIRDRETRIKLVQTKTDLTTTKVERLTTTLEEVKRECSKQHAQLTMNLEQCLLGYTKAVNELKQAMEKLDMKKPQSMPELKLYYDEMKDGMNNVPDDTTANGDGEKGGGGGGGDSSYVLRMQAQLCKAMHCMGMMEIQSALLEKQSNERQKYFKEVMKQTADEKSVVELQVMNGLIVGGDALREVEGKHKAMLSEYIKEKDALMEKIEKQQERDDDEEGGTEEEEDENEKEELKEVLNEGREEVEKLEAENMAQLETLIALKAKVAAIRGESFVEELVASISEEYKPEEEEEEEEEED